MGTRHVAERPNPGQRTESSGRSEAISLEDAQLVVEVQNGHPEAYGTLVERYQDRVFNACWRIVGNLEDARDLTQDAFLKGFEGLAGFRGESGFYTWIFRVAVNLALSHRRSSRTRRTISLDQTGGAEGTQAEALSQRMRDEGHRRREELADGVALRGKVVEALQTLDADHRAVLVLRDIEGFDYRRIAEILGIAIGTVKSRLFRARMAVRDAVTPPIEQGSAEQGSGRS
jgi:RNA polymerase sigma-70 factor (ECF subfamily)